MRKYGFTLAEVFSPHCAGRCKTAFTLAEVLITLGIIGVVAAMTMPSLIAKYQDQVAVNKLKKSYSMWSQVFQKILVDEGVEKLSDTEWWNKLGSGDYKSGCWLEDYSSKENCKDFFDHLKKYTKIGDIEKVTFELDGENAEQYIAYMPDGTKILNLDFYGPEKTRVCDKLAELNTHFCASAGDIWIDVSNSKSIRINDKRQFLFQISDDGKLYPIGGRDSAYWYEADLPLESNDTYWKSASEDSEWGCPSNKGISGCAGRIMENGWKIDW